ncbi:MAG: biopolymer transporter ExbD [Planctomycetota bacterium]|nr:biopolymer transporter ExbD [Planctomycetota bacterium]
MARRAKPKRNVGEVETDMTSMIDVVFLLLIFFMLATKFKLPEGTLRSYLPKNRGESNSRPIMSETCRITLMNQGGQVIAYADQAQVPVSDLLDSDFEQHTGIPGPDLLFIEDHIGRRKATYVPLDGTGTLPVVIDFAENVPYKYVMDVLNICARARIDNIAFAQPEIPLE